MRIPSRSYRTRSSFRLFSPLYLPSVSDTAIHGVLRWSSLSSPFCVVSLFRHLYDCRMVTYSRIRPPAMKQAVHHQRLPCKQRPAGSIIVHIYPFRKVLISFSPLHTDFAYFGLLCRMKRSPAQRHKSCWRCCCWSCRWS